MNDTIIQDLRAIFVESLHIDAPPSDTDLFESGTIDSLQLVELLLQLERRFGVTIGIEDIDLDNLRTLARIARLVAGATAAPSSATAQPSSSAVRWDKGRPEKKLATS